MNRRTMRRALTCFTIALLPLLVGCGEQPEAEPEPEATGPTSTREVRLAVEGMTCEGCVNSVKSKLAQMPGIDSVNVSLEDKAATVRCAESVTDAMLVAAVEALRYEASIAAAPSAPTGTDAHADDPHPAHGDHDDHAH